MMKKLFLNEEVKSDSTMKSYLTIFKRIDEFENEIGKSAENWNKEDILDFLSVGGSTKLNTLNSKLSLLKKYLLYIGNKHYENISIDDLKELEHRVLEYISYEQVLKDVEIFQNNIDKALILLIRNGIRGEGFEELAELKVDDIQGNVVHLANRKVILDDKTSEIVNKAKNERGYHMTVKSENVKYTYYHYNLESEYFWKNRPNKYNNQGLNAIKETASKDKITRLLKQIDEENLTSTSLVSSYVVDKILDFENRMNMNLSEIQVRSFIEKLGITCSMYSVYTLKQKIKNERNRG